MIDNNVKIGFYDLLQAQVIIDKYMQLIDDDDDNMLAYKMLSLTFKIKIKKTQASELYLCDDKSDYHKIQSQILDLQSELTNCYIF